jgi:precorrin-2 dehydrogenase/sirohydrochlorin ferrochelatase
MRTHAVFLRLEGRRCVVVGGDAVAERKVEGCLAARASVTVVAGTLTPGLERLCSAGRIACHRRPYRHGDLRGAALVYAVERDADVIAVLRAEAAREGAWLNVVDVPEASSFFAPAIVARGELQVAIGTGGASPGLASRLRRQLETHIGPEYGPYVDILGAVRRTLPGDRRAAVMDRLVDSDLLALVRRRETTAIDALLTRLLGETCTLGQLGVAIEEAADRWT